MSTTAGDFFSRTLEAAIASCTNAVFKAQPPDPVAFPAKDLESQAQSPLAAPSPPAATLSPTSVKADPPPNRPAPHELGDVSEALEQLASLDDRLEKVLRAGDICLFRSKWLLEQEPSYRIQRRQDLDERALLSCKEAVELIKRRNRCIGALTYGWPSAGDPDPTGHRVAVLKRALCANPHIEACFWE